MPDSSLDDPGPPTRPCMYCRRQVAWRAVSERYEHVNGGHRCATGGTTALPLPEGMRMRGPRTPWGQR